MTKYKFFQYKLIGDLERNVNAFVAHYQNSEIVQFDVAFDTTSTPFFCAVIKYHEEEN